MDSKCSCHHPGHVHTLPSVSVIIQVMFISCHLYLSSSRSCSYPAICICHHPGHVHTLPSISVIIQVMFIPYHLYLSSSRSCSYPAIYICHHPGHIHTLPSLMTNQVLLVPCHSVKLFCMWLFLSFVHTLYPPDVWLITITSYFLLIVYRLDVQCGGFMEPCWKGPYKTYWSTRSMSNMPLLPNAIYSKQCTPHLSQLLNTSAIDTKGCNCIIL